MPAVRVVQSSWPWFLAFAVLACSQRPEERPPIPPVVAGLDGVRLDTRSRGLVLLDALGCRACHHDAKNGGTGDGVAGPDLTGVGTSLHAEYLPRFLGDVHGVEPGTTMPNVLRDRDAQARTAAAEALAAYLRSFPAAVVEPAVSDPEALARGRLLFHEIGCVACHAPRDADGHEMPLPGSVPLGNLAPKWQVRGLREFLLAPQTVRPSARMPDLHLAPGEAADLAGYLLQGAVTRPTPLPPVDPAQVATGRQLFAERGCANCHRLDDSLRPPAPTAIPLNTLDPTRGCLSGVVGPWPDYELSSDQRSDIVTALREKDAAQGDEQRILQILAARNCTACHQRGDHGGVTRERNAFFTTADVNLGQDGRLPPPLTGVGAKLQREWLVDAVAHGQAVRPYQRTRMPGFGNAVATELAELFTRVDGSLPAAPTPLPKDDKQAQAITELGRELVGDKGMNCITCHAFAGEHVGTMASLDLVDSTAQRLRPEWFRSFLQEPSRFKPGTVMPQFFIGGVSARPQLGGGDVGRQLDAIWHYLTAGRNVRKPSGMRSPPIELTVGDDAVMLRRSVQNTGKRGISVGLPLHVNLTFDAETLGMNQIWWGSFIDASGVWTGQGSGEARVLGKELATLPKGPAFVELPDPEAPWPAVSRRDLGQQFLGYDLDSRQRPTFRYVCAGVTITDATVDLPGESLGGATARPILRRTLTFASAADKTLHFRAALAARVEDLGNGSARVGPKLLLRMPAAKFRIRPAGEQREVLFEVAIRGGRAELVIEYLWQEQSK